MFYEALGNMIAFDKDIKNQGYFVQTMMQPIYNDINEIFNSAGTDSSILQNMTALKAMDLIIKINEKVAMSVGTAYYSFGIYILGNIFNAYAYYCDSVDMYYANGINYSNMQCVRTIKFIKKTILQFLQTFIKYNLDESTICNEIVPQLSLLIDKYRSAHVENKDPDVLLVFSEVLQKIRNFNVEYINNIWQYLCLDTLDLIKLDFQSYPDHRMNFYSLIKAMITFSLDCKLLK